MSRITNTSDVCLALSVWLVDDNYDHIDDPNYISVTSLMKPLRHIVLPRRIPAAQRTPPDVVDFIASSLGSAIHDSIEKAWLNGAPRALKLLGYPDDVIENIKVNPTDEEVRGSNSIIPVYLEQRAFREIDGFRIGGKFDMVAEGIVHDNKSTSAYAWVHGTRDEEHILQMSLYRWIDAGQPTRKITEDFGCINYIFTDWSKMQARRDLNYPQKRVATKNLDLLSLAETEAWVRSKLATIKRYMQTPESQLPLCTDEELWRSDPVHKYFADPLKAADPTARSSKNFTSLAEANRHRAEKGKGVVITKPGEPKRCEYCPAFDACTQKDLYFNGNP